MTPEQLRFQIVDDRLSGLERRITEVESLISSCNAESVLRDVELIAKHTAIRFLLCQYVFPKLGIEFSLDDIDKLDDVIHTKLKEELLAHLGGSSKYKPEG
jgi:hypothetical protein